MGFSYRLAGLAALAVAVTTGLTTAATTSAAATAVARQAGVSARQLRPQAAGGKLLWLRRYNNGFTSGGGDVAVSPDGSTVFVTGTTDFATIPNEGTAIAYDAATGARQWVAHYMGPKYTSSGDGPVAVSPDGSTVFVIGNSASPNGKISAFTILAYDAASGATLWTAQFSSRYGEEVHASGLAESPDGSQVFVTGADGVDPVTLAYDASTGALQWMGSNTHEGTGIAVAVSPDGSTVYVAGNETGPGGNGRQYVTTAYDASTGATDWAETYYATVATNDDNCVPSGIAVSPDGSSVFVTGVPATVAYDAATGARLWLHHSGIAYGAAIAVSPDGSGVFLTGPSDTSGYQAVTGARMWARGPVKGNALAVSPDSSEVFAVGYVNAPGEQWAAVAFSASSGKVRWKRLFGGLFSAAGSVAVSPQGSAVYVTGFGAEPSSATETFVTAAYRP
jgi:hypothetical protein